MKYVDPNFGGDPTPDAPAAPATPAAPAKIGFNQANPEMMKKLYSDHLASGGTADQFATKAAGFAADNGWSKDQLTSAAQMINPNISGAQVGGYVQANTPDVAVRSDGQLSRQAVAPQADQQMNLYAMQRDARPPEPGRPMPVDENMQRPAAPPPEPGREINLNQMAQSADQQAAGGYTGNMSFQGTAPENLDKAQAADLASWRAANQRRTEQAPQEAMVSGNQARMQANQQAEMDAQLRARAAAVNGTAYQPQQPSMRSSGPSMRPTSQSTGAARQAYRQRPAQRVVQQRAPARPRQTIQRRVTR